MSNPRVSVLIAACFATAAAVAPAGAAHHGHKENQARGGDSAHRMLVEHAIVHLRPTRGQDVEGVVLFTQLPDGVRVDAEVHGLKPNSRHGFHIHEFGDIGAPDGTATGGHYNPGGHAHALPDNHSHDHDLKPDNVRHAGDLGNLEADAEGVARFSGTFDNFTIAGAMNPVLGRGMIVHAKADDGGQPSGNAGDRIAQGVIGVDNPAK